MAGKWIARATPPISMRSYALIMYSAYYMLDSQCAWAPLLVWVYVLGLCEAGWSKLLSSEETVEAFNLGARLLKSIHCTYILLSENGTYVRDLFICMVLSGTTVTRSAAHTQYIMLIQLIFCATQAALYMFARSTTHAQAMQSKPHVQTTFW